VKVQIVYLNPEDDIHSTRDMLSWVKAPRALLLWPAGESVLSRRLDLVLLKRYTQQIGLEIGLVTFDKEIREEAYGLGIPVFESMDAMPEEKWIVKETPGDEYPSRRTSDLDVIPRLDDPEEQVGWLDKLSRRAKAILVAAVVLSLVLGLAILLPSVRVILSPSLSELSFRLDIDLLSDGTGETEGVRIPIQTVVLRSSGRSTRKTSGLAQVPLTAAVGVVTFTSLSQEPIEISIGTTLRTSNEDGVQFRTTRSASLEGEIGAVVEVPIEAITLGWRGNMPAQSISLVDGPLGLLVQVSNTNPTSGGQNEIRGMVLQEDMDQVEKELMDELMQMAECTWYDAHPTKQILVGGSLELRNILERKFDHGLGEVADAITLELDLEFSALVLSEEDLQNLARNLHLDLLSSKYLPVPEGFIFSSHLHEPLEGSQNKWIEVEVIVDAYHVLDVRKMREVIRGKKISAAKELLLERYPLTSAPEFRINPNWYPFLPLVDQRIDFVWSWE
jgi:hypothetical protein